ncbi:hypothetical protein C8R45DRAFT_790942, partial [Mycena sanguinolenta]
KFDIHFVPANSQIRCLAHVVNLIVQKILASLGDAEDPDVIDYYLLNKDTPFHYDADNDPDIHQLEQEVFSDKIDGPAEEDEIILLTGLASKFKNMHPLQKLRTITTKICSSPQRRKRFRATAEEVFTDTLAPSGRKLASLLVVRDAIDRWVFARPELRPLSLDNDAWDLLSAIGDLLKMFTQVTEQMSRSRTPTLPWVLPMYEGMLKHLREAQFEARFPSLRNAAAAGLEKLEQYYSKACDSQLNIVATLLHPSLGIQWFRKI